MFFSACFFWRFGGCCAIGNGSDFESSNLSVGQTPAFTEALQISIESEVDSR